MGVAELERKSSEGTLAQGPAGSRGTNRVKVWERIFQAEGAASEKVEMRLMCCGAARRPLVVKVCMENSALSSLRGALSFP